MKVKSNNPLKPLNTVTRKLGKKQKVIVSIQGDLKLQKPITERQIEQLELELQNDELKVSHEIVEKERTKFTQLFNLAPIGYIVLDKFGVIEDLNHSAFEMLCEKNTSLKGRKFQNYITPEGTTAYLEFLNELSVKLSPQACQAKLNKACGKIIFVQMQGVKIIDVLTKREQLIIALFDISEIQKAELEKQQTQQLLSIVLKASSTGSFIINYKSGEVILDEIAAKIFSINNSLKKPLSQNAFLGLTYEPDKQKVQKDFNEAFRMEKEIDLQYRILSPSGDLRYIELKGRVVGFGKDEKQLAGIILDITEKKRREGEEFFLKMKQQKAISLAVVETQEKERKRISTSLHDSLGQLLYATKLQLSHNNIVADKDALQKLVTLLDEAIKETRNISYELAPSILADFGIEVAVKEMAKRVATTQLKFKLSFNGLEERPDSSIELIAYRIIQELVNNAIKHGYASVIEIKITQSHDKLSFTVKDNGTGFNPEKCSSKGSGLLSIKSRLELFNGRMNIESKKTGTFISVYMGLKI